MKILLLLIPLLFFFLSLSAQRFETKEMNFSYVQYPLIPVKGVNNYNSTVMNDYEQKNQALMEGYNQEVANNEAAYQQSMNNYQAELQQADADYASAAVKYLDQQAAADTEYQVAMRAYNYAGGANSNMSPPQKRFVAKPVKRQVMMPVRNVVRQPYYPKMFDQEKIKSTYIQLEGMSEANENALQIIVTLKGYEQGTSQVKQRKKNSKNSEGETITTMVYYGSVQGKHVVHVQVITPAGQTIMDEIAVGSGTYSTKNTKEYRSYREAQNKIDQNNFTLNFEEEIMRRNMNKLKKLLNNRFGFPVKKRRSYARLFFHKKMSYPEYQTAYENLLLAYPKLNDLGARADLMNYASKAIDSWENAMRESSPDNKKARINKKVSRFTCLMLAEAYMWTDNFTKAEEYLAKMKVMKPLVNERKWSASLEKLLASRKRRITAYNQAQ